MLDGADGDGHGREAGVRPWPARRRGQEEHQRGHQADLRIIIIVI